MLLELADVLAVRVDWDLLLVRGTLEDSEDVDVGESVIWDEYAGGDWVSAGDERVVVSWQSIVDFRAES